MTEEKERTANSRFAKAGGSCFYESEVLNSSFVYLMKFSAENPRLRKAAKRYASPYDRPITLTFDVRTMKKNKVSIRQKEIVAQYLQELDKHLTDLKDGKVDKTFEIKDLADLLFVSPKHLSNTIQEVLGKSPCDIYEERLIEISKSLLLTTNHSISHIAQTLTFDPSNFTKFFKSYVGLTPSHFKSLSSKA